MEPNILPNGRKKNSEKRKPKNEITFSISLNEEQKIAKSQILENTITLLRGQAGSGKTLLACQKIGRAHV